MHCFKDGYVGKKPVASKEYCTEYWEKELKESIGRCTGHRDIAEIAFKWVLKTIQSIQSVLTLCYTILSFNNPETASFRNYCGK